ncbi:MAG: hypothetical protein ACM3WU_03555 [Bacillota bacterium]
MIRVHTKGVMAQSTGAKGGTVLYHSLHLPRSVKVSSAPFTNILRFDGAALVYEVNVGPDRYMRHYSFPDRWFRVNCNLDSRAHPVSVEGPIPWAFDCSICTPQWVDGRNLFSIHLFIQVLVSRRGRLYYVKDMDLLDEAAAKGWVTGSELEGARGGLKDLTSLLESGKFMEFLSGVYPLGLTTTPQHAALRAKASEMVSTPAGDGEEPG